MTFLSLNSEAKFVRLSSILSLGLFWGLVLPVNASAIATSLTNTTSQENSQSANNDPSCSEYQAVVNTLKPLSSNTSTELPEAQALPTSTCAADLETDSTEPQSPIDLAQETQETLPPETTVSPAPELSQPLEIQADPDRWRYKFQPYATIPISTYGTATVKGQTVNYSLSLAQLLQFLTVAASGRVEAWKGNWGFIIDGYYANLKGINSFEKVTSREPGPINTVNYVLTKGINTNIQDLANQLNQQLQALKESNLVNNNSEILANYEDQLRSLQSSVSQNVENLQTLATNLQSFRETLAQNGQTVENLTLKIEDIQQIGLQPGEGLKTAIALNNAVIKNQENLQDLRQQIQSLNLIPKLEQIQEKLLRTQAALEKASQKVQELQQVQDSEQLQKLKVAIDQSKEKIDQRLQEIQKFKDFQDNGQPQELNADIDTSLQFNQGIYDFAVSYNFGDTPPDSLPKEPSELQFPRFWFQPIAGVRLNDINIQIENTINYEISSSLVNLKGTSQNTVQAGKTWFEPMVGGKLGLQLSDPIILWLRGDVSGFDLAADTDFSWNLLFGMDYWVRENISLQLAYRFYSINYKNGTGSNAFGFSENFNGPYLSATFNF